MKLYILTCINESAELLSVDVFRDFVKAQRQMYKESEIEEERFREEGKLEFSKWTKTSAECGMDYQYYRWDITEKEINL